MRGKKITKDSPTLFRPQGLFSLLLWVLEKLLAASAVAYCSATSSVTVATHGKEKRN